MASFDAQINLDVNNTRAVQSINKVEKAFNKLNKEAANFEKLFSPLSVGRALNQSVGQAERLAQALRAQKEAAAAFNNELERTARILRTIQTQQKALPAARAAAGALPPGRTAGLLPAAGQTGANSERAQFDRAALNARRIDEQNYRRATQKSINAANALTVSIEAEVRARRQAATTVEDITQTTEKAAQKLLPPATAPGPGSGTAAGVGTRAGRGDRYRKALEQQVAREIASKKGLTAATERLIDQFNERLNVGESVIAKGKELVKATDRQVDAINKETKSVKSSTAKRKNKRNVKQDILLGAGFPLLFGGGLGQAAAGAIGGGVGGFGGAIAAQAVVSQITALNTALVETASITASTGNAYDFLSEKQLFSSQASRELAEELAELGRVEELAALATEELVGLIGNQGVENLQKLDKEWNELLSNLAELGLAIGAFMAKYLAPLIELLNTTIKTQNRNNRFNALISENAEAKKFYEDLIGPANRRGRREGVPANEARNRTLEKFEPIVKVEIPVTPGDVKRFAPPKPGRAPKERESRIPELERELALQTKILGIQEKISAAELAKDSDTVARLEGEIKLAKLATDRAAIIADIEIPAEERRLQLAINSVEIKAAEVETSDRLNQIEQARIQNIENSITGFENEVALMQEETEFAKDLLRIEQQIAELRKNDPNISEGLVERLRTAAKAAAEAREEQRKYNEVLSMAQGPINAFVNGITQGLQGIVDGTMSAQEAFAKMLRGVADSLVQTAATMIAQYLAIGIARKFAGIPGGDAPGGGVPFTGTDSSGFGGTNYGTGFSGLFSPPGRATGGPVTANQPYIVGERGPELYVPNTSGSVVSNEMLQRYGANGGSSRTIRFESTVINNVEYVTSEQAMAMSRAAADDGAKRGAEGGYGKSMRALQNSRSQRNKLGMTR